MEAWKDYIPIVLQTVAILYAIVYQIATFKTNFDLRLGYLQKELETLRGELLKASVERYTATEARASWDVFRAEWTRHLSQCEHCREKMESRLLNLEQRLLKG